MDSSSAVFELRIYTPNPNKLPALEACFRDHTVGLFAKHGITLVGFWRIEDPPEEQRLIYLLRFPSRQAATEAWDAFRADPAWLEARAASEVDGPLNAAIESRFMRATDYSPIV